MQEKAEVLVVGNHALKEALGKNLRIGHDAIADVYWYKVAYARNAFPI